MYYWATLLSDIVVVFHIYIDRKIDIPFILQFTFVKCSLSNQFYPPQPLDVAENGPIVAFVITLMMFFHFLACNHDAVRDNSSLSQKFTDFFQFLFRRRDGLTHWVLVRHGYVSMNWVISGSCVDLSQTITRTNAHLLSFEPFGTNFVTIWLFRAW